MVEDRLEVVVEGGEATVGIGLGDHGGLATGVVPERPNSRPAAHCRWGAQP